MARHKNHYRRHPPALKGRVALKTVKRKRRRPGLKRGTRHCGRGLALGNDGKCHRYRVRRACGPAGERFYYYYNAKGRRTYVGAHHYERYRNIHKNIRRYIHKSNVKHFHRPRQYQWH